MVIMGKARVESKIHKWGRNKLSNANGTTGCFIKRELFSTVWVAIKTTSVAVATIIREE